MARTKANPVEYVMGEEFFRVEEGVPHPKQEIQSEEVDTIPVDRLKIGQSLRTNIPYNANNVSRLKTKINYYKKHSMAEKIGEWHFSITHAKGEDTIRVYRTAESMAPSRRHIEATAELN